jgi:Protein of unknown function (DUF2794)
MGVVTQFPSPALGQVVFDRLELNIILNLYGRMVAEGEWRDYAIAMDKDVAVFSAFRRASERPEIQVVKRPALRLKQGQYALHGEGGAVLARGAELKSVLAQLERRLLKLVEA